MWHHYRMGSCTAWQPQASCRIQFGRNITLRVCPSRCAMVVAIGNEWEVSPLATRDKAVTDYCHGMASNRVTRLGMPLLDALVQDERNLK